MDRSRKLELAKYAVAALLGLLWWMAPGKETLVFQCANLALLPVSLVVMRWRSIYPVAIALALVVLHVLFPILMPVAAWAYVSLCAHRRWWATGIVGGVFTATVACMTYRSNAIDMQFAGEAVKEPAWALVGASIIFALMFVFVLASVGAYTGARRAEKAAWEEKLALAHEQAALTEARSRAEERNRIAREMHDVLAHKLSLISMHAGALSYRDDLSIDEVREAASAIQEGARYALTELRVILGQLRQTEGGQVTPPQPTMLDLDQLIAEHRDAGARIEYTNSVQGDVPVAVSRQGYRVVQEALTNATKHAPGATITVAVTGTATDGVAIRIMNPMSAAGARGEGARLGLIGLDERVAAVGGTFTAGPVGGKDFVVEVQLPW